jgi:hypothetical protein
MPACFVFKLCLCNSRVSRETGGRQLFGIGMPNAITHTGGADVNPRTTKLCSGKVPDDVNTIMRIAMKLKGRWAWMMSVLLLVAAAAWAKTTTDYDHGIDFSKYKTYSWGKLQTANSLWDQRVKQAVDSQLAARGWTQVPSGGEAVVCAFGKTHAEQTLNTFYDGFGGRRRGFGGFGQATTTTDNTR